MEYFEHRLPCEPTLLVKFRKSIGEDGIERLLAHTIAAAQGMKLVSDKQMQTVVVDTTVQEKAIAHPTDNRLLEVARQKLVDMSKDLNLSLKRTFVEEGKRLSHQAGRYAHARQFNRMRKAIKRQGTIVNKLIAAIERQIAQSAQDIEQFVQNNLDKARRIIAQS